MSSKGVMSGNVVDKCCDITTDAVPDRAKTQVENNKEAKPTSRLEPDEEKSEVNNCGRPNQKCVNKPTVKTKTRSVPKSNTGAANITYNISNANGVHIGNNFTLNCTPKELNPKPMKETKEMTKLLQIIEPVTLSDINTVSRHVGSNWKEVGRNLGYSNGQLEQFQADHGGAGLREVVYQLLLDWKQVNTSKAAVGVLCGALKNANQKDALTEWVKIRL